MFQFLWQPYSTPRWFSRRIYKTLRKKGKAPAFTYEKDFYGLRYQGKFDNHIDIDIFYFDAFEKPMLFFMRDYLRSLKNENNNKLHFVDIGANIGQHTIFVAPFVDRVNSFEPFNKVGHRLLNQIKINNLKHVNLHEVGVGNLTETIPFYAPTGSNMGIGSFVEETTNKGNACIGNLQIVNGDEYFTAHEITNIDMIKIDVEGLEKYTLQGLKLTLDQCRPLLLLEITYQEKDSFTSLEELKSHLPENYDLYFFNKRKKDGSKARRQEAKDRSSGRYEVMPFTFQFPDGQDDIIAVPKERKEMVESLLR